MYRVLSRIYRLGEKSLVAEGYEFLGGSGGISHPEIFSNEYALSLRCNLVHLQPQCVHWPGRVWIFFRYSYL